ncbi:MAG: PAS domain-containing protein [Verrucomicrobiota bacterium]
MNFLHNLSFKRKLLWLTLLTTSTALGLAGLVLVAYETLNFRQAIVREVSAQAKILANLSTGALSFGDPAVAREMLNELRHEPHVAAAAIFDEDNKVFATYQRLAARLFPLPMAPPDDETHTFQASHLLLYRKVQLKNQPIGTVLIVWDMRQLYVRIGQYVGIVFGVLVASSLFALWLSSRLQRAISTPILQLCATAHKIADEKDFSLRAEEFGTDEIGVFTLAFNQMLAQIQFQDAALKRSGRQLDALIHSIDGIVWESTPDMSQFTFVSRQSERLLGYKPEDWMAKTQFWHLKLHPQDAGRVLQSCQQMISRRDPYSREYRMLAADGRIVWMRESGLVLVENERPMAIRGIFQDVTEQKARAEELAMLNRRLVEQSRQAGMAEVATGVLHNVGNVLNSVNVSATFVSDRLRQSKVTRLQRAADLLANPNGGLVDFLTHHPKGKVLPQYLCSVAAELTAENAELVREMNEVGQHVSHIKEIVAMQQSYAKVSGAYENLSAAELVEDALRLNSAAFERHRIEVSRQIDPATPAVCADRHKVLQILINLLQNAKYALEGQTAKPKRLTIQLGPAPAGRVRIIIADNGIGIAPENLIQIFNHGFTTKKDGHGFGLHSGANAAKEMGGSLTAQSDGVGHGAAFSLELPVANATRVAAEEVMMEQPA